MSKNRNHKLLAELTAAVVAGAGVGVSLYNGNTKLETSFYRIGEEEENFFRIVQISDLHGAEFGKENAELFAKIRDLNPDLIAVTGDVIYGRNPEIKKAANFFEEVVKICPVAFCTGNHEEKFVGTTLDTWLMIFEKLGVDVLDNTGRIYTKDNMEIYVGGVSDRNLNFGKIIKPETDRFSVLLAHEPQYVEFYAKCGYDMVITGHAHGGQIRLPHGNAVVAPGQGILPKYTSGKYKAGNTAVYISRGLGKSLFPFRIFNRPEICVYDIYEKKCGF
ncbi:MAG: metallophosphoesterase [Clostridia bacterium]|nr:metallophosphoesterase [Clostridia bacterium]